MAKKKTEKPVLMAVSVAAGFPSPAEQYVEAPLDLNELLVRKPAATFFVRAAGDSMVGAGICSGDILVVDRSLEAVDGSIVIAAVDNEFTVKFLRKDFPDGTAKRRAADRRGSATGFTGAVSGVTSAGSPLNTTGKPGCRIHQRIDSPTFGSTVASRVRLEAANRRYKPILFDEGMELRIFGVVTAVIHQFVKP